MFVDIQARTDQAPAARTMEALSAEADPGRSGQKVRAAPTLLAAARSAAQKIERGRLDLTPLEQSAVEAIIIPDRRPAFDIVNGDFVADHHLWRDLSTDPEKHTRLKAAIPSVGRVELPGQQRIPYGGTGFVVGRDLLMTNRHVAEIFALGLGVRRLRFRTGWRAAVDFRKELDAPEGPDFDVRRVLMIHPWWDMALLQVPGIGSGHPALRLSTMDARETPGRRVALVGYPAYDPLRNDPNVQDQLFRRVYRVKRLLPGELAPPRRTESFGKLVDAAAHDASSLGGASGSAVVDIDSGEIVALHFGGRYLDINFAVPMAELARDPRVLDLGLNFVSQRPQQQPPRWLAAWDSIETTEDEMGAGSGSGAISVVPAAGGNSVSFEVPLRITIELGAAAAAGAGAGAGAATTASVERMVEPRHDTDYRTRKGYRADFLEGRNVPMPKAVNAGLLAPLARGSQLDYQNFSILMHRQRRVAWITAANVSREAAMRRPEPGRDYTRKGLGGLGPNDSERWFEDLRLDPRHQLPDVFFTKDQGAFDKGHIVRREDVAWGATYDEIVRANGDTFHVTNCSPQVAQFNQSARGEDNWGDLENLVFASAAQERLCVFAGPVLSDDDHTFVGRDSDGQALRARIPNRYWKVIVAATGSGISAHGFVLEQDLSDVVLEFAVPSNFRRLHVPISAIEEAAGVDFGDAVRDADAWTSGESAEFTERAGVDRVSTLRPDAGEPPTPNIGDDNAAATEDRPGAEAAEAAERVASWRVAKALLALRRQVNARAPQRSRASDGTIGDAAHASRSSDHNPWVRDATTGVVTALDITHDPGHGCDAGELAQAIVASRDPRLKYVIWNRRIANSSAIGMAAPWAWRDYAGSNPHDKHVHVSVKSHAAAYDDESDWPV